MIKTKGKTLDLVIEEIMEKLVGQGGRCVNDDNLCVYGDGVGNHCAVGWLLPEDNVDLMNFGGNVTELLTYGSVSSIENFEFIKDNVTDLTRLQALHDLPSENYLSAISTESGKELGKKWIDLYVGQGSKND